jgi:UDP-N-acetylmuramoyl-tripeptide--D-alanyl-D-alanine ligase
VIPLTLDETLSLCAGPVTVSDTVTETSRVTGVRIDSRRVGPGDLFVAVGGGREFVADALARGAIAAVVPDEPFAALAALGRAVRDRSAARVVAITGSTGKTSTKDILAALCAPHARTVAAEGGHNNELGLPLTLTRLEPDTEVLVAEMGMRGLGQIAELCAVARPDVGVITSIGPVHLELLGTVERVAQAKAEVVAALPPGGTAVLPADAPELDPFVATAAEIVRVGPGGDVTLTRFEPPLLVADVAGETVELEVTFTARHQARNTLAALAAYRALGLPLARAGEGAADIRISPWRGEEIELPGGGLLINDAYNANPVSMRAALEHLVERAAGRRTVAVLGEMAELGPGAPAFHRGVGEEARRLGVDVVMAVGDSDALVGGYAPDWRASSVEAAVGTLRGRLEPGDVVLVKASRAAGLEVIAESLAGAPV